MVEAPIFLAIHKLIVSNFVKEILVSMDVRFWHLRANALRTAEVLLQGTEMGHTSVIVAQVNDKNVYRLFEYLNNCL